MNWICAIGLPMLIEVESGPLGTQNSVQAYVLWGGVLRQRDGVCRGFLELVDMYRWRRNRRTALGLWKGDWTSVWPNIQSAARLVVITSCRVDWFQWILDGGRYRISGLELTSWSFSWVCDSFSFLGPEGINQDGEEDVTRSNVSDLMGFFIKNFPGCNQNRTPAWVSVYLDRLSMYRAGRCLWLG